MNLKPFVVILSPDVLLSFDIAKIVRVYASHQTFYGKTADMHQTAGGISDNGREKPFPLSDFLRIQHHGMSMKAFGRSALKQSADVL